MCFASIPASALSGVQFCNAAAALKAESRSTLSPVYSLVEYTAAVYLLLKYLFEFVLCDSGHHPFLNLGMKKRHPFEWR